MTLRRVAHIVFRLIVTHRLQVAHKARVLPAGWRWSTHWRCWLSSLGVSVPCFWIVRLSWDTYTPQITPQILRHASALRLTWPIDLVRESSRALFVAATVAELLGFDEHELIELVREHNLGARTNTRDP